MNLFELFKLSRTLQLKDGEILLMSTPVNMVPTTVLADMQKSLIDKLGFVKAYTIFYESAKNGAYLYNKNFIEFYKFKDKRDILEWQRKVVTMAGWGNWKIQSFNTENNAIVAKIEKSVFAGEYGQVSYPVDIIPVGFSAGGMSANFGSDLECIETKCIAMGDPYCEIEIGPPELIIPKREQLWKKWKLI